MNSARAVAFLDNKLYSYDQDYFSEDNLPANWEDMTIEECEEWEIQQLMGKGY